MAKDIVLQTTKDRKMHENAIRQEECRAKVAQGYSESEQRAPGRTKIAIIGKAPSSRLLAPYDKTDEWEIWSISDNYNVLPRWDRWFELHDLDRYKELYPEFYDWLHSLDTLGKELYVTEPRKEIPAGLRFPHEALVAVYGYYFTNSISWLHAYAIEVLKDFVFEKHGIGKSPEHPGLLRVMQDRHPSAHLDINWHHELREIDATIGLWGVDMAQHEEYASQRPGCEYHIGWSQGIGIKTIIPDECDMMKCSRLYAVEANRGNLDTKIRARKQELSGRAAQHNTNLRTCEQTLMAANGALGELHTIAGLNGQLNKEWIEQRIKLIETELRKHQAEGESEKQKLYMLQGAIDNLEWSRQWA